MRQANGLALTTDDPAVVAAVDGLEAQLLRYGKAVADYLTSPAPESDCALALAYAAAVHLFALTAEGRSRALPLAGRALRLARTATERERLVVEAVAHWAAGDLARATAIHMGVARRWPADLISAKICQLHQLNAGDFAGMLGCTSALVGALPGNGWTLGMHAFALGQVGDHVEAERAGRRAAALNGDPWAHHAVAHVLDDVGRHGEGRAWMRAHAGTWESCSSFMYTHNWWHAALFHLDLDDPEGALDCFDARIWGVRKDYCQDQLNAISLLARLEMRGVDVGERWHDLSAHVAPRLHDHLNGFLDLHYVYALARAERTGEVGEMLRSLDAWASSCPLSDARLKAIVPVAARALVAHAQGNYERAAWLLRDVRPDFVRLGGSDVQRHLFELIYRDSCAHGGMQTRRVASA